MSQGVLEGNDLTVKTNHGGLLFQAFWEVHPLLKCPVVGLGISDASGRRILKRCGRRIKDLAPWQVHRDLMEAMRGSNPVARRVDAFLKRRFGHALGESAPLSEEALFVYVKAAMVRGDGAEALYCVAMRRGLSLETLVSVHGEVHMMGHSTTEALFKARKKAEDNARKGVQLKESLETERRERRRMGRDLAQAQAEIKGLDRQVSRMKGARPLATSVLGAHEEALRQERDKRRASETAHGALMVEMRRVERERRRVEREKRKFQIRSMALAGENRALADEVMHLAIGRPAPPLKPTTCKAPGCENRGCCLCPEMDTCQHRVLMVGGLSRMEPHYRRVAEAKGLGFEYHDGTMSGGRRVLENQVSRCDMVVCPVSCNSHNACRCVKRLCTKHSKEIRFLPTSSISALTGVLHGMPQ